MRDRSDILYQAHLKSHFLYHRDDLISTKMFEF